MSWVHPQHCPQDVLNFLKIYDRLAQKLSRDILTLTRNLGRAIPCTQITVETYPLANHRPPRGRTERHRGFLCGAQGRPTHHRNPTFTSGHTDHIHLTSGGMDCPHIHNFPLPMVSNLLSHQQPRRWMRQRSSHYPPQGACPVNHPETRIHVDTITRCSSGHLGSDPLPQHISHAVT